MVRGASVTGGIKIKKMLGLEAGQLLLVQQKGIVDICEHEQRENSHEWLYLHMDITENLVTVPAANKLDYIAI